jgi:hypothetical protein
MIQYNDLKEELLNIASVLEKYPDILRPKVFDVLLASYTKGSISEAVDNILQPNTSDETESSVQSKKEIPKIPKRSATKKTPSESYSIDRNLDLRGSDDIPSFKEFYEKKKPSNKSEFNAVTVYYLKNLKSMSTVSLSHAYTCYKEIGLKPAEHFKQSFIDTKNKQGYIEYDENWNLLIPHRGVVFVEHALPPRGDKT